MIEHVRDLFLIGNSAKYLFILLTHWNLGKLVTDIFLMRFLSRQCEY